VYRRLSAAVIPVLVCLTLLPAALRAQVPAPEEFFGTRPGTSGVLLTWDRLVEYYRAVAAASPRVQFTVVGQATSGAPFVMLLVSDPANLARAEELQAINRRLADPRTWSDETEVERLIDEGRAVVMQNCAIHATEVGTHQAPPLLLYELATSEEPDIRHILDNVILLLVPSQNPDGTVMVTEWWNAHEGEPWRTRLPVLYQTYTGHDNNRDWYTFFQQETRLTLDVHNAWHPQMVIDQHQQGSRGSRIFVPPFEDPVEPNVDPVLVSWLGAVGPFVSACFITRGMPGVEWGERYDAWSPARAYHHYKGALRVLTEVASADWADPITIRPEQLPEYYHTMRTNFPSPWPGGEWTLEQIVRYHHTAARSLLLFAANNRRQLLEGFAACHERSLAWEGSPLAFVIPSDQPNLYEVGELLDILQRAEVEIVRAGSDFEADHFRYEAGSWLIDLRQPYGRFARAVLAPQNYPDLRLYEGGPPDPPYDVTGHTLPLLMGVDVVGVQQWEGGDFAPVETTRPAGRVTVGGRWLALPAANNGSLIAAARLRAECIEVFWTSRSFTSGGRTWPAGTILVRGGGEGAAALRRMGDELSLIVSPVNPSPTLGTGELLAMGRGRVGLLQSWFASMEAGWTHWVLDHYGFDYEIVRPRDLAAGGILDDLEVLIVPGESERAVVEGWAPGEMPAEYVGGAGPAGLEALRRFVHAGGAVIAWGGAREWVAPVFDIYLTDALAGLGPSLFSIPGSILRADFTPGLPVNYGLREGDTLWFRNDAALLFEYPEPVVLARYAAHNLLASGYALGAEYLLDRVAAGGVTYGEGAVLLFGFTPQYRAQSRNTMKMIFTTILGAGNPQGAARLLRERP